MNKDQIEGKWTEMRGKIKEQWGKLTDDEIDKAEGKWEQLSGLVQQRYGRAKETAEKEVESFRQKYDTSHNGHAQR